MAVIRLLVLLLVQWSLVAQMPLRLVFQTDIGLPSDLLVRGDSDMSQPGMALQRIDARTGEMAVFYEDTSAWRLDPLTWSPHGTYLAVLRVGEAAVHDLCILDREGTLKRCFEGVISSRTLNAYDRTDNAYWVSWSSTGESVYFVKEDEHTLYIVEGDVTTGEISAPLYSYPKDPDTSVPGLYWDSGLAHVVVLHDSRIGNAVRHIQNVTVVDLKTDDAVDISGSIPDTPDLIAPCAGIFLQEGEIALRKFEVEFVEPPSSKYIELPALFFVNSRGETTHSLDVDRLATLDIDRVDCPAWQPTGENVFFLGYTYERGSISAIALYRYTPSTDDLVQVRSLEVRPFDYSSPVVSPDGTVVIKYFNLAQGGSDLTVVFPDGRSEVLKSDLVLSTPLWFPAED